MMSAQPTATTPPAPCAHQSPSAPRVWDSASLFGNQREISIVHQGEHYRLRITRQERLILTK